MAEVVKTTFRLRRGDINTWRENNPILKKGEPGVAYENGHVKCLKIGDGVSPWNDLEAIGAGETDIGGNDEDYIYIGTEYPENAPIGSIFINESEEGVEETPDNIEQMEAYTTITKTRPVDERGKLGKPISLNIHCHNLIPGEQYKIYMYKAQRQRAKTFRGWTHSPNFDFDDSSSNICRLGYAKAIAKENGYIPEWMPNNGYLQTEWDIPENHGENYILSIDFREWILPMLKNPEQYPEEYAVQIIGLQNRKAGALWMKWKVIRVKDQAEGECQQTVKIGTHQSANHPTLSII